MIPLTVKIDMNAASRQTLIGAGKHFYCLACTYTLPVRYRSEDERYCLDCYRVITERAAAGTDEVTDAPYAKISVTDSSSPARRGRGRPRKEINIEILETGKTQMECAKLAGVSQSTISRRRRAAKPMLPGLPARDQYRKEKNDI